MKINVKEEWREDIYLVEKEEIIKYIKNLKQKYIHNISWNNRGILIWADWNKKQVINNINKSDKIWILLWKEKNNNMWHSLSVVNNNTWLEIFDIKIEIDNLIINN